MLRRSLFAPSTSTSRVAAADPPGWTAAWAGASDRFVADLAREGVFGGATAFRHGGRFTGFRAYGVQDCATGRPVDSDTLFHWASITKTYTAVAAMQLRDAGKLKLSARVVDYCPEIATVHDPFGAVGEITLQHLLTHSAGFRSATFPWVGDKAWQPHEPARWEQVAAMMPYTEIEFAPGSKYSYSNLGLSLVGRMIEAVSDEPYQEYVVKNLLMPLGMTRAYFDQTPRWLLPHRSNNYDVAKDGTVTANGLEVLTGATLANGGLNASFDDFGRYTDFLVGVDRGPAAAGVLSRETLREMWEPRLPAETLGQDEAFIGLGFFVVDHRLPSGRMTRWAGHGGFQLAFHTAFQVNPDTGSAFMAAANTVGHGRGSGWSDRMRATAYETLAPLFDAPSAR